MHHSTIMFMAELERAKDNANQIDEHFNSLPDSLALTDSLTKEAYLSSPLPDFCTEICARRASLIRTIEKCDSAGVRTMTRQHKRQLAETAFIDIQAARRSVEQYRHRMQDLIATEQIGREYIAFGMRFEERATYASTCSFYLSNTNPRIIYTTDWGLQPENEWLTTREACEKLDSPQPVTTNETNPTAMITITPVKGYHPGIQPEIRTTSHWSMGFEIEKTSLNQSYFPNDMIADCDFKDSGNETHLDYAHDRGDLVFTGKAISHVETDSSCGLEIVTHAYDALKPQEFIDDIELFDDYLDSPCDRSCGGHITIGLKPETLKEYQLSMKMPCTVRDLARPFLGLLYGIHRRRLRNSYCCQDAALTREGHRYSPCHLKRANLMEIRVFSKVRSLNVLRNRANIVSEMCKAIDADLSYQEFAESITPTLRRIIGDTERFQEAMECGKSFAHYLITGEPDDNVFRFIL